MSGRLRAWLRLLERHERAIIEREQARHLRRLQALGPGPQVASGDFAGCVIDGVPPAAQREDTA